MIELVVAMAVLGIVLAAAVAALSLVTRTATSGQAYSHELQDAQVGIARIVHDLRSSYSIVSARPNAVEFYQWSTATVNGATQQVTEDIEYDCGVPQPGTSFDECMRVQAIYPNPLPDPATGTPVVQRLVNGGIDTYCNSNAVFHYVSATSNGSGAPCTEAAAVAAAINPVFVEVRVLVPAKGGLTGSSAAQGFQHTTVLDGGAMLRNANVVNQAS